MGYIEHNQVKHVGIKPVALGIFQVIDDGTAYNSTITIYQVPAGKTFYMSAYSWSIYGTGSGPAHMAIRDADNANKYFLFRTFKVADVAYAGGTSLIPAMEIPADWDIAVYSLSATCYMYGLVHGWVE